MIRISKNYRPNRLGKLMPGLAAVVFFLLLPLSAQVPEPPLAAQNLHRWGTVTQFNGLPSGTVRAITQTTNGILWFGTDSGLARFDGRRVLTVPLSSDPGAKVLSLSSTDEGFLLIGTELGAFVYRDNTVHPVQGTEEEPIIAFHLAEQVMAVSRSGKLFEFGPSSEKGARASEKTVTAPAGPGGESLEFTAAFRAFGNTIIGTSGRGPLLSDGTELTDAFRGQRPYFVRAIAADNLGNVWIGGSGGSAGVGVFSLDADMSLRVFGSPAGDVLSLAPDGKGGLWVGTNRNGLFHFRSSGTAEHFTFENTAGNLRSNTVYSLFVDADGVIWAGTNRGISRFDPASPFHQVLSEEANGNFVRTFYSARNGNLYAGTNRGLFVREGSGWALVPGCERRAVYAIGEDDDGKLLIGTPNALLDAAGRTILEGDIRGIAVFNGALYAAVYGRGLVRVTEDVPAAVIPETGTTTLTSTGGAMLVGTAGNGIFRYDGSRTDRIATPEAVGGGAVWRIVETAPGHFLFACARGLFSYNGEAVSELIGGREVRDAAVYENDIWAAASEGGLLHLRRDEIFGPITAAIGTEQGLPSDKAFAIASTASGLIIGTNRGIAEYSPGGRPPDLMVTRVLSRRLHGPEEFSGTIELDFPQNSLLVEVAGLNSRTFPEEFRYGFRLIDQNGAILDDRLSNEPQFSPANLKPGVYAIEAVAFGRDLVRSEPVTIRFGIGRAPFPWTATALGVLLAIALVALVWAIIERRRIAESNRQLATARLDLANEAERERRRIARDLHDQTLADLRSLIIKSDRVAPDLRGEIESVSTDIRRICEDLSPSVLENVGLVAALEFLLGHTVEKYFFNAPEHIEERIGFPVNVQLQIYRIVQEVLSNIERHANAGMVRMNVSVADYETFSVVIEDDGAGFEPAGVSPTGRGIANINARASLIQARIKWKLLEKHGTRFSLKISPADDPSPKNM